MMLRPGLRWHALLLWFATVAGTTWAAAEPPYLIDAKRFQEQVRRVAVAPVDVPDWMGMPTEQRTAIDVAIQERLDKAGFEVLPNTEYRAIEARLVEYLGGLAASDGTVDPARLQALREHSIREMLLRHRFDALVLPRVVRVNVPWSDDRAEWDGTKQTIESKGRGKYSGQIAALSLEIRFVDRSERPLYIGNGGLEVLQKREQQQLVPLPAEQLWQDEKRAEKAVTIALKSL